MLYYKVWKNLSEYSLNKSHFNIHEARQSNSTSRFSLRKILYTFVRVQHNWAANQVTVFPCSCNLRSINRPACIIFTIWPAPLRTLHNITRYKKDVGAVPLIPLSGSRIASVKDKQRSWPTP